MTRRHWYIYVSDAHGPDYTCILICKYCRPGVYSALTHFAMRGVCRTIDAWQDVCLISILCVGSPCVRLSCTCLCCLYLRLYIYIYVYMHVMRVPDALHMYVVLCACLYEPRYALGMTIYHLCVRKCPFALEFTQEDGVLYPGPSGVLQRTEVARAIIGGLRPACNWPSHEPNEWKKLM